MTKDWFGEDAATFGDRMAAAREAMGLTQAALAARLGVRPVTVQNWEGDRSEPRANKLQMLAGLLNVSILWLLTGRGEGVSAVAPPDAETLDLLGEIRDIRQAQARLLERMGRLEKRLRARRSG